MFLRFIHQTKRTKGVTTYIYVDVVDARQVLYKRYELATAVALKISRLIISEKYSESVARLGLSREHHTHAKSRKIIKHQIKHNPHSVRHSQTEENQATPVFCPCLYTYVYRLRSSIYSHFESRKLPQVEKPSCLAHDSYDTTSVKKKTR